MQLSIIIPAYQVERTLRRCVESVLCQEYRTYEIWLVDDGSTDNTPAICEELSGEDARVHVIHQANAGLSAARNAGLRRSHGEYVTFLDSDDYISSTTLKAVMQVLRIHPDYDILEYPAWIGYAGNHCERLALKGREYTDIQKYWFDERVYLHAYAWNKIYRRTLFKNIQFPVGRNFEDIYTLPKLLMECNVVATCREGLCYYCDNSKGITHNASAEDLKGLLDSHLSAIETIGITPSSDKAYNDYFAHVVNIQLDVYEATREPLQIDNHLNIRPTTFKTRLMKVIGIQGLCVLNRLLHRFYRRS